MATSAEDIFAEIINSLKTKPHWSHIADDLHPEMKEYLEGIAEGVYKGMQKLEDTAGSPPSSSHV